MTWQQTQEEWSRAGAGWNGDLRLIVGGREHLQRVVGVIANNQSMINHDYTYVAGMAMKELLAERIVSIQPALAPVTMIYQPWITDMLSSTGRTVGLLTAVEEEVPMVSRRFRSFRQNDGFAGRGLGIKIAGEIDQEILTDISRNCAFVSHAETFGEIRQAISDAQSAIWRRTNQAVTANWIVVPEEIAEMLRDLFDILQAGSSIYVVSGWRRDTILIGWKGNNWFDSAYTYCPYLPINNESPSDTFTPGYWTRYGKKLCRGGSNYFAKVFLPSLSERRQSVGFVSGTNR